MSRHIHRILMAVAMTVGIVGCTAGGGPSPAAGHSFSAPARPSVGYLQHRDSKHQLRDLMDPTYRAASSDEFARRFTPDTAIATIASGPVRRPGAAEGGTHPGSSPLSRNLICVTPER